MLYAFPSFGVKHKILILHSYHQGLSWTDNINKGLQSVFFYEENIDLQFEYMDTKRYSDSLYLNKFSELYKLKHSKPLLDIVVCIDNNALEFVRKFRDTYFEDIPVVFACVDQFTSSNIAGMNNVTGVSEQVDFKSTIKQALILHPKKKNMVLINDNKTLSAKINRNYIDSIWSQVGANVKLHFLENLSIQQLKDSLSSLDDSNIILLVNFSRDKNGNYISYKENIKLVKESTDLPIYSSWQFYLGKGIVGGMLTSGFKQGEIAANLCIRILSGENANSIPIVTSGYNNFMFDYNQMKRYGIYKNQLPSNSIIINQADSFYILYRRELVLVIFVMTFVIMVLLAFRLKKMYAQKQLLKENIRLEKRVKKRTHDLLKANELLFSNQKKIHNQNIELEKHRHNLLKLVELRTRKLKHANDELEQSRKRLLKMLDSSSDGVWEHNLKTGVLHFSDQIWLNLGYKLDEVEHTINFVNSHIHPLDIRDIAKLRNEHLEGKTSIMDSVFRLRNVYGKWLWYRCKGKIMQGDSIADAETLVGTLIDITKSKLAEEKIIEDEKHIRASEKRWRSLIEQSEDLIFLQDLEGNIIDANSSASKCLKYSHSQLLSMNFSDLDCALSIDKLKKYWHKISSTKQSINIESIQKRQGGSTYPVEINFSLIDIDDNKVILATIRNISKRKEEERKILNTIIITEERERKRFAKDLHDSLGPIMACINMYLSALVKIRNIDKRRDIVKCSSEAVAEAIVCIKEISNNLSPHVLNNFGLEKAINSFITKVQKTEQINISFNVENISERINEQLEVVVYRVVTELIHNTIKHANADNIEINLSVKDNILQVIYIDDGVGFDLSKIEKGKSDGMGIYNIISRVKSLNGNYKIKSKPNGGGMMTIFNIELFR